MILTFRVKQARKALRALKGLVRLQAIVRGQAVRRQTIDILKRLPSNRNRQSVVQERRSPAKNECFKDCNKKQFFRPNKELEENKLKVYRQDDSISILKPKREILGI